MLVLNEYETIDKIKQGYSLARYGDGEFFNLLLLSKSIHKLQKFDEKLKEKLSIIFSNPLDKLLIGIPRMQDPKPWVIKFNKEFSKFIFDKTAYKKSTFVSAFMSRPSVVGLDNQEYFDEIKSIWKDKEIVLINFNNDILEHSLFAECVVNFIKVSRRDCFDNYDSIYSECKKFYNTGKMFLVSAGPTATCLSYDITFDGEQCVDIGQIAFEYSLFKNESDLQLWTSQDKYKRKKK